MTENPLIAIEFTLIIITGFLGFFYKKDKNNPFLRWITFSSAMLSIIGLIVLWGSLI